MLGNRSPSATTPTAIGGPLDGRLLLLLFGPHTAMLITGWASIIGNSRRPLHPGSRANQRAARGRWSNWVSGDFFSGWALSGPGAVGHVRFAAYLRSLRLRLAAGLRPRLGLRAFGGLPAAGKASGAALAMAWRSFGLLPCPADIRSLCSTTCHMGSATPGAVAGDVMGHPPGGCRSPGALLAGLRASGNCWRRPAPDMRGIRCPGSSINCLSLPTAFRPHPEMGPAPCWSLSSHPQRIFGFLFQRAPISMAMLTEASHPRSRLGSLTSGPGWDFLLALCSPSPPSPRAGPAHPTSSTPSTRRRRSTPPSYRSPAGKHCRSPFSAQDVHALRDPGAYARMGDGGRCPGSAPSPASPPPA